MVMLEIDVNAPPQIELARWEAVIEARCLAHGLRVTLKGALKRRLWFKVGAQQQGAWMGLVIPQLKNHLEQQWMQRRKVAHV